MLERGQRVRLRAYGDEIITRRVVAVVNRHVYITTGEEYRAAEIAGRKPVAVGFRLDAVVTEEGDA